MRSKRYKEAVRHLQIDLAVLAGGILVAILLVRAGTFAHLLTLTQGFQMLGAFIAGIFFTSTFTVALSAIAFVEIGSTANIFLVALIGALGGVFGDMLLFLFIRDTLTEDLKTVIKASSYKRLLAYFHGGFLKWIASILGALVIASPLPDELGLTILGISKTRSVYMIPLSFTMNFFGIWALIALTNLAS